MTSLLDVRTRCAGVFARVFSAEADTIADSTSPDNLEGWDSLGHVQLVVALEKEFGLEIPPDEALGLENFGAIVALLARKLS